MGNKLGHFGTFMLSVKWETYNAITENKALVVVISFGQTTALRIALAEYVKTAIDSGRR
jgi:hypothetical protein